MKQLSPVSLVLMLAVAGVASTVRGQATKDRLPQATVSETTASETADPAAQAPEQPTTEPGVVAQTPTTAVAPAPLAPAAAPPGVARRASLAPHSAEASEATEASAAGEGEADEPDEGPWRNELFRFDLGGFFNWYTAAVEVGTEGESNRQLITDLSFGLHAAATWRFWGPFSLGMYMQFETGERDAGRFTGTVMGDLAVSESLIGGSFSEVWWGPLLRAQWESLFLEVGWGPLAFRTDNGRPDLPAGGSTDGAFQATPSTTWLLALGASVPVYGPIELVFRISYRVRYYETRGGTDLDQGVGFGTQDVIPFIGAAWAIDRSLLDS